MQKYIALSIASLCVATASLAGSPAAAAGNDWSGFYAGGTFGTGTGGNLEYDNGGLFEYDSLEPGTSFGGFAGYNMQQNNTVYGGEIAYSQVDVPGFGPVGFPLETFNYFADAKARVGIVQNNFLLYGFAGYSFSNFEFPSGTNFDVSGLNFGAGVDVMVNEHMFVGGEYIFRNLSGETDTPPQTQTTNIQAVQLRAGWKF